ncbi:MAG: hypothetical protein H8E34_00125 [Bacteroidetes bacterium]|nr:hypothetical protein [Bacteroidota bacterium]
MIIVYFNNQAISFDDVHEDRTWKAKRNMKDKEGISEANWMKKPKASIALSKSHRSLNETLGYLFR